jgi:hypothetical protein
LFSESLRQFWFYNGPWIAREDIRRDAALSVIVEMVFRFCGIARAREGMTLLVERSQKQSRAEKWAGSSAKAPSTPCLFFCRILRGVRAVILRKHAHHTALINHSAAVMRKFHGRPPSRRRSTKPPQCRPREADTNKTSDGVTTHLPCKHSSNLAPDEIAFACLNAAIFLIDLFKSMVA